MAPHKDYYIVRDAAGISNAGGLAIMWWAISAPLVVIGLIELSNSGWAKAHPVHTLAASLIVHYYITGCTLIVPYDLQQCLSHSILTLLFIRYLLRFFDFLAHPNLSATFATGEK